MSLFSTMALLSFKVHPSGSIVALLSRLEDVKKHYHEEMDYVDEVGVSCV